MATAPKIIYLIRNRYDLATVRRWVCDELYGFVQQFSDSTCRAGVCVTEGACIASADAWADSPEDAIRAAIAEHKAELACYSMTRL